MSKKEPPKKQKPKPNLPQKERFIEYAKEIEADETGETFDRALKKIIPTKETN